MVEMNGEVIDEVMGIYIREVEVVLIKEGKILLVDLANSPEMQMIKVYIDVLLHKALLIHQFD